ncbi:3,4-dehydroadipyl-CoA semialdehyde dehydrogenase [Pendulispora albinea]|uniref:3,4-dehydroadipyl-CoA semialdehyde dehydrogenase n=1 Tax=Pendulispora albinea TaxID=2741071 RepID=A0ABZ2LQG5_9BACT
MIELESYLQGQWVRGSGRATTLVNPATEAPIATSCTEGIDFAAALEHARNTGGPALRAMNFAARAEMLRSLSRSIHSHRDELIGLAIENGGNTRSDAKFDIDGASLTLAAYADIATELAKEAPSGAVLVDGAGFQLARSPRLFGTHLYVPREGVAVHINAFNFPAWGLAEKAAVALCAGVPVVSKPASSTALVAHRLVKLFVEEKLVPEGALSFIAGSPGNLLDHLRGQDVLAFTGAGTTGAALRAGRAVREHSVRVNVEADSLNAAVLGPDVADDSEVMNLFLTDVVRDMTQKTGQKCTAIRRIYVPANKVATVLERLGERLGAIKVGDPSRDDVGMGPLATAQQLADVRAGITKLLTETSGGRIVLGSTNPIAGGDGGAGKGFFISPVLLHVASPKPDDAVHTHEVFGPVATVMPYASEGADHGAAAVVRWVAAGGGGLVSSVYSDDKSFVRAVVLGIAPYHGRVTIGSSKIATQAIPPGTVLAQLVHGGPGRAGGGEELGGRRGLSFYLQRVALQGDRALLELISGQREATS